MFGCGGGVGFFNNNITASFSTLFKTGLWHLYIFKASSFKQRLYEHRTDFNNQHRKGTRLSTHVWSLKSRKIPYTVSWKILAKAPSFNPATKTCKLCLKEKWFIMLRPEGATLNHRSEFFSIQVIQLS